MQHDHREHQRLAGLLAATGPDYTAGGAGRAYGDDHHGLAGGGAVTLPAADARGNGADPLSSSGRSADFRRANLDSADLDPARALCANFTDVDFTRTKLGSATLSSAYLTGAT